MKKKSYISGAKSFTHACSRLKCTFSGTGYLWLLLLVLLLSSLWCIRCLGRMRGSVMSLCWLRTVAWFGDQRCVLTSRILRGRGGGFRSFWLEGLWVVISHRRRLKFRVSSRQRVVIIFILTLWVEGIVGVLFKLSVLWSGGVLGVRRAITQLNR